MIEGIIVSILSALIIGMSTLIYKKGYLHSFAESVLFQIAPSGLKDQKLLPKKTTKLQKNLVRKLLLDQNRFGHHKGQYGKSCDAIHSKKWQTKGSDENLNLKPRMYLTYWPVLILQKHNLARRSVNLAISGIENLFTDSKIPVHTSAPSPSPTNINFKWNHRHSMAGAHLLALAQPNNKITRSVVDQMLDKRNSWQDITGGWWQTSEMKGKPDLWASVYAVKLLDFIYSSEIESFQKQMKPIKEIIKTTFLYLENEWNDNKWGDSKNLLIEENVVSIYIDLASMLPKYSPKLLSECVEVMKSWLSPIGDASKEYLNKLSSQKQPIYNEQAYARLAYAFYLAEDDSFADWKFLFEKSVQDSLDRFFSSELAFLIDLSIDYTD